MGVIVLPIFLAVVGLAAGVGLLVRNELVYRKNLQWISTISEMNSKDIEVGRYSGHRWFEVRNISYHQMVLQFWKPLDSWAEQYDWGSKE